MGLKAPDFTLNDLENKAHSLSDYRQRLVVNNFWYA
jgi:peroxiredoxin